MLPSNETYYTELITTGIFAAFVMAIGAAYWLYLVLKVIPRKIPSIWVRISINTFALFCLTFIAGILLMGLSAEAYAYRHTRVDSILGNIGFAIFFLGLFSAIVSIFSFFGGMVTKLSRQIRSRN